ncbi:uncharacterized protein LOC131234465 isoform X2 [Magnolia sinica]|uniref:uncharacterized protein LOC131234465 isoform X2 n=1 Tax=Magnolia sinica TaxID=86752 RepID=UPI00265B39B3|nr:uncharacterized protein LOC131234465 isoform X2 [Magnolia sinica]
MASALLLRRFYCCSSSSNGASALDPTRKKKQLVFMGSPQAFHSSPISPLHQFIHHFSVYILQIFLQVSASVLDILMNASKEPNSMFQLAALVTQPPSARNRGRKVMPSPVAQHALDRGFPRDLIFTPERAGEETFLTDFKALKPELCVTAAYGNILPSKFLEIPQHGTVNIHPSLLPLYRGAAPVQRALQDGVKETGVSLVYTVRALDAGPIIDSESVEVDNHVKSIGSKLLIRELPSIFDGSAKLKAQVQDDSKATLAPKIKSEESWLSFTQEASVLHNKVRAFAGWPGTRVQLQVLDGNGQVDVLEIKVITTRVGNSSNVCDNEDDITFSGGVLVIPCAGRSALEVLEIQLPGKKVMSARDFWNGLQGRKLQKLP